MENSVKHVQRNVLNARRRLFLNAGAFHSPATNACCDGNKKEGSVLTVTTSIMLFFAMLLAPMAAHAAGGSFGGGDGLTINTPLIIEDADDLNAVRSGLTLHYKLGNDIDLTNYLSVGPGFTAWNTAGWLPIGTLATPFSGSLDGAGKKITGLWINRPTEVYVGLFGYTIDAVLENLGIEIANAEVKGANYTGGLVGLNSASLIGSSITNCYVTGNVTSTGNGIGGLVGRQYANHINITNNIKNCYTIGNINGGDYVAILVGTQVSNINGNCVIENCYSSGMAIGSRTDVGGITGYQCTQTGSGSNSGNNKIINCYSTGDITGRNRVGGIVGFQYADEGENSITNCYATGRITAVVDKAGGIVGEQEAIVNTLNSINSVSNCFTTGDVNGLNQVFGLMGNQISGGINCTNSIVNCFRYQFATVNGAVIDPLSDPDHGRALRHGDVTTTAVDFMTQATYSTNGWTFGPWYWNNSEKFPKLNIGPEVYPFPFFAITYYPDGGVLPADAHYSYVSGETYTLPTLTKPKYIFDGWADSGNTLVSGIIPSSTGHQDFWAKWTQYIFDVTIAPTANGSVVADTLLAQAGETITLTVTPNDGYLLESLIVHRTGNESVIVATSAGANNTFTFVMPAYDVTVRAVFKPIFYAVTLQFDTNGGYLSTNKTTAIVGETVTITISPNTGWELLTIYANNSLKSTVDVSIKGTTGNTCTFTMPAFPVTVTAIFDNPAWQSAITIIENANFSILQKEANTLADLRYKLAEIINQLIAATGIVISPNDVVIFEYNFIPAQVGISTNHAGANGFFEFRVTLPGTRTSAYNSGIIAATAFDPTGNDNIKKVKSLIAWTQNSQLFVNGLLIGQSWSVYNMEGALVYQGIASDNKAVISIPVRGLYIVLSGDRIIKIIN